MLTKCAIPHRKRLEALSLDLSPVCGFIGRPKSIGHLKYAVLGAVLASFLALSWPQNYLECKFRSGLCCLPSFKKIGQLFVSQDFLPKSCRFESGAQRTPTDQKDLNRLAYWGENSWAGTLRHLERLHKISERSDKFLLLIIFPSHNATATSWPGFRSKSDNVTKPSGLIIAIVLLASKAN